MEVVVTYHKEAGTFWADSPTIDGYSAVGESLHEVRELVHSGVPFFLDLPLEDIDLREQTPDGRPIVDLVVSDSPFTALYWRQLQHV
jgi:predicted RNase H-like HicB family nuclease